MKSERRHELKENELEHYLGVARDYFDDHGKRIGLIAVVAGVIFVSVTLFFRAQASEAEGQWGRKSQLSFADPATARTSLETLTALAQGSTDPSFVMSCLLAVGQQSLRMSVESPFPPDAELNNRARDAFEELLRRFPNNAVAVGAARLGLASVSENDYALDGDIAHKEEAAQQFASVIDDPALDGLPYKRLAMDRRKRIDNIFTPTEFAEPTAEELAEAEEALEAAAKAAEDAAAAVTPVDAPTTVDPAVDVPTAADPAVDAPTAVDSAVDEPKPVDAEPKADPANEGGTDSPDDPPSDPDKP